MVLYESSWRLQEVIDEGGKEYFLRAIQVCSQVFNTLTESIQVRTSSQGEAALEHDIQEWIPVEF